MELEREHIRAIIFYNWKRGLTSAECEEEMRQTLGTSAPHRTTISRWYTQFDRGQDTLKDDSRPGRIPVSTDDENVEKLRVLLKEDPHMTTRQMMEKLKIGSEAVNTILHQKLQMHWVCNRIVPHTLTPEQKALRVKICKQNLKWFKKNGARGRSFVVTGDETYIHLYDAPTRKESKLWLCEDEPPPDQVKRERTVKKFCYAVFFRSTGLVKAIRLTEQKTITAKWFVEVCLPQVFEKICSDRPNSGLRQIRLHYDNATSHTSQLVTKYLADNKVDVMPHPPYSPDIAPCDFWLFSKLKRELRGQRFADEDEVDIAVNKFLEGLPKNDWLDVFESWQNRMKRVIELQGDYIFHL
jgi:histone-lysine N-methyltransferase SETMAR